MNLLKFMRETPILKYALWLVILSFILAIFVLWGGAGEAERHRNPFGTDYAVKVGGAALPPGYLRLSYQLYEERMRSLFGDQFRQSYLKGSVKNLAAEMVDTLILEELAAEQGLSVSDQELATAIARTFRFTDPKNDYPVMLSRRGVSAQEFERYFRSQLLVRKFYDVLLDAQYLSDEDLQRLYREQNDRYKATVAFARTSDFRAKLPPLGEPELRAAYERDKSAFTVDEKRTIKYVNASPMDIRAALPVTEAEVKAYYDSHKEQFGGRPFDQVKPQVKQTLLFVDPAVKERADKVFQETSAALKAAKDEAAVAAAAAKAGLKVETTPKPFTEKESAGALGLDPALNKAVFAAEKSKWADPVEFRGGVIRFLVTGVQAAHPASFEEARAALEEKVQGGRAAAAARAAAESLARTAKDAASLEAEAKRASLGTTQTGELSSKDTIPLAGVADPKAGKALAAAAPGTVVGPLGLASGYLVAVIHEHKPADMAKFAKERDQFARQQAQETVTRLVDGAVARRRKALQDQKAIFLNDDLIRQLDPASAESRPGE